MYVCMYIYIYIYIYNLSRVYASALDEPSLGFRRVVNSREYTCLERSSTQEDFRLIAPGACKQ